MSPSGWHLFWSFGLASAGMYAIGFLCATYLLWWFMRSSLRHSSTGIVPLALADSSDSVNAILATWRREGLLKAARLNVRADFLFAVAYSQALGITCILAARAAADSGFVDMPLAAHLGLGFLVGAWAAAALDWIENIGLLRILPGASSRPTLPALCAAAVKSVVERQHIPADRSSAQAGSRWRPVVRACAVSKFALVGGCLLFAGVMATGSAIAELV